MNLVASMGLRITKRVRRKQTQHAMAGYGTPHAVMMFMRWACERDQFPTVADVMAQFKVSRTTAYRWTGALAKTYGLDPSVLAGGLPGPACQPPWLARAA